MNRRQFTNLILVLFLITAATVANAAEVKHANIRGTYKLVSRVMTDSTIKKAPEVIGLLTFTKTYRNFNVSWKDAAGKTFSYSVISKYTLTDSTYSETKLYSCMDDEIGGTGLKYDFEPKTQTVKSTFDKGKVTIKMPFDPVTMVFDGDKATATGDTGFIDSWYRIR